ncbi:MAG TPA: glycosyltransferase family 4 protein [Thermoplasmata archaeon]|nr:glycosyltransferase family 4 protein [Thermoplasmata archaeon]
MPTTDPACILQIADYSAPFASNFLSSLFRLEGLVRDRLGLRTAYVLPEAARERPWIRTAQDAGAIVEFLERGGSHRQRIRTLRCLGLEHRAALLHTHFGTFDADAAVAAWRLGRPVVWHMHSPFLTAGSWRRGVGERIKFGLVARLLVDRIVAVSPSVAEGAVAGGAPRSKFSVVLNGIDVERAHPLDPADRSALRRRTGIADGDVVFLLLGWEPLRKGADLFAEAMASVSGESAMHARGLVVRGETNEAEVLGMVRSAPSVRVIPGVPDVAELYGLADCFVSASRAEGLPYAVGEAMAADLPVITSDLAQVVAVYGRAGAGVLTFRSGDAKDLAAAMARLLATSPEDRVRLGRANGAFIREGLSLRRWSEEMIAVYRSVLGTPEG